MPEISRFYGIVIRMYYSDHNPPHFHANYQGYKAEYEIKTLDLLNGKLPKRAHALVIEWASEHKSELLKNWQKREVPEKLEPIKPLE